MKKIILLVAFAMSLSSYVFGQTYYYKCVEGVYDNGVKCKCGDNDRGMYITFTKESCYESDKNGYIRKNQTPYGEYNSLIHYYKGTENGILVYPVGVKTETSTKTLSGMEEWYQYGTRTGTRTVTTPGGITFDEDYRVWCFSSDKTRLNEICRSGCARIIASYGSNTTWVYERGEAPSEIDAPKKLY